MKWISCKDRLPEKSRKTVLWVTFEDRHGGKKVLPARYFIDFGKAEFFRFPTTTYILKVTHWMPLPEPPKE